MEGEVMRNFFVVDSEDINFIWYTIQQTQVIFHPELAPDGIFDFTKFFNTKRNKSVVLFIDRNILSGFLQLCEKGSLQSKNETQIIGLIMAWAEMNNIIISAGLAIQEGATQVKNQEKGLKELQKFLEAYNAYSGMNWLQIARKQKTDVLPVKFSGTTARNITVNYSDGCDHYYMLVASMLHVVNLYRKRNMKPVDKIMEFLRWTYDNLLLCQYMFAYAILLFTEQKNIKAPKGANTNDIERIVSGCKNQAWDISYLSNWSIFYRHSEEYKEEFLFATNDVLLKRIFINTHGPNGINGLLYETLSKKDYLKIYKYIEECSKKRNNINFGEEPYIYVENLIGKEKEDLINVLRNM